MKQVMFNLVQVQKSLEQGTYKTDSAILTVLINESIKEISNSKYQFEAFYCSENWKEHFVSYENLSNKYKAAIICDLHELDYELNKDKVNRLKCLVMVQEMINSKLYSSYVKRVVDKWVTKNGFQQSKMIEV